jgi:hypothetical protein
VIHGQSHPVGGQPKQVEVVAREPPRRRCAYHQDSGQLPRGEQRHTDHRVVRLPASFGVSGEHRLAGGADAAREALTQLEGRALAAAGRAARGRPQHQAAALLGQIDGGRIGAQHGAQAGDEHGQDRAQGAMGERGVDQLLHAADHVGKALRLGASGLLAQQRLAFGLAPQAVGHVAQEAGGEHLTANGHPRHPRLGGEAVAVAMLELELQNSGGIGCRRIEQSATALVVGLALLGWDDQSPQGLPDRLGGRPAQHALGGGVPGADDSVAIDGDEGIGRAVEHDPRAGLVLLQQERPLERIHLLRANAVEQSPDQQPRGRGGAYRHHPAHEGTRRFGGDQDYRVGDPG